MVVNNFFLKGGIGRHRVKILAGVFEKSFVRLYTFTLYIHFKGKPIGTPDAGAFFRVIEQHKVVSMFTAPTAIRIIRAEVSNTKDTF